MSGYEERLVIERERIVESVEQVSAFVELLRDGDVSVTDRQGQIITDSFKVINEHLDVLRLRLSMVSKINSYDSVA